MEFLSRVRSERTNHSHFTPGGRQKNYWDTKDPKSFKPVLKTEQSLLARERRTILQWNPVEKKISNFGDIFPLYPNFIYHSLSLSIWRKIKVKKRHLYSWTVNLLYVFDTVKVYITVVKEFMYFYVTMWSMLLFHASFQLLFALCYLA